MRDGGEEKENQGGSEDETDDGNSSNTDCDQDSDISFMNDTDEEIDTAESEEEDWIDYMKRSTSVARLTALSQYTLGDGKWRCDFAVESRQDPYAP